MDRIRISGKLAEAIVAAVVKGAATPPSAPAVDRDWYTDEAGVIHIDWDHDPARQLSLMLKPDGKVGWAICIGGEGCSGLDAMAPEFMDAIRRLSAPVPQEGVDGWRPIPLASMLPLDATGCSGPCAVLLSIDTGRPGPFIRQARYDMCARAFVCDSTGETLRDAIAFIPPNFTPAIAAGALPQVRAADFDEVVERADEAYRQWYVANGFNPHPIESLGPMRAALEVALAAGLMPKWTDEQCIEFMAVALRHVEYKRGSSGPTCDDIRMGVHRALAAAPAQGVR